MNTDSPRLSPIRIALLLCWAIPAVPAIARQDDAPEPLPSDPMFEATAADGSAVSGRIRLLSPEGRLVLVDGDGDDHAIEAGALVKLARTSRVLSRSSPDSPIVVLAGGDQIRGQIDEADEDELALRSPILDDLTIPLDVVLGFSITPERDDRSEAETIRRLRDESRATDRLFLVNGDERDMTFSKLDESELSFLDDDRSRKLSRDSVRAIGLDPGLARVPDVPSPSFDLLLTDGSRLRLVKPTIREGRLSGSTTFGAEVALPLDRVSDLYVLGDSVAYLSDRDAAREINVSYVGPTREARPNASVLGEPITVGGRRYLRGLGTQSRSLLAYPLGPEDRRFQASIALDDAAGALGNVVFRVLVDGEQRFASEPVASGDPPAPIDVDVSGGQFLILATEFGRAGGVRDYASWIEARLIRGPSPDPDDPDDPIAGNTP